MTSEIRVNKLENRVGLGTIEYSNTGPVISGVTTASNFKTGSSNLHSSGVEVAGVNVLGADTPIGLGATIYNSGAAVFTGVVTATSFSGSGDLDVDGHTNLDNVSIAGIATALRFDVKNGSQLSHFAVNQIQFNPTGDAYIDHKTTSKDIIFRVSNSSATDTTPLVLKSNGKVGIGSAIPDGNLTIHGPNGGNPGLTLRRDSSGGDIASIAWATNSASYAKINYRDATPHGLQFYSGGTASSNLSMIIRHNGNIGINENEPSEKLQIDGDILLGGQANSSESNYAIKFEYNNHQFAKIVGDGRDSTGYGDIDFYTSTGSGASNLTQRMSIRADGKIGIGDFTSVVPDSLLHINGISGTAQVRLQRINAAANTNDYGRIYFESTDNVLTGQISVARESAENNGYMHFKTATGGTLYERLRISSTGVVTVNTASLLDAFKIDYGGGFNLSIDGGGNIKHYRANGSNGG